MFETAGGGPIALDKPTFYLTYQFGRKWPMRNGSIITITPRDEFVSRYRCVILKWLCKAAQFRQKIKKRIK